MENDLKKWTSVSPQVEETNEYAWDSDNEKDYDFVTFENKLTETQIVLFRQGEAKNDQKKQEKQDFNLSADLKFDGMVLDESDQVLIGSSTEDTSVN